MQTVHHHKRPNIIHIWRIASYPLSPDDEGDMVGMRIRNVQTWFSTSFVAGYGQTYLTMYTIQPTKRMQSTTSLLEELVLDQPDQCSPQSIISQILHLSSFQLTHCLIRLLLHRTTAAGICIKLGMALAL